MARKFTANIEKALRDAAKASEKEKTKQKEKRETLIKKVGRKLRMIYYGPKYHAAVTKPKKKRKKPKETAASLLVGYARKSGYRK